MTLINTFEKFGFPKSVIKEYENWYLLLRYEQITLGSLILICKDKVNRFSEISRESFKEFIIVIKETEEVLKASFEYNKINYLMLMMEDSEVHFHIIPRYSSNKYFSNFEFVDFGWPGFPSFSKKNDPNHNIISLLQNYLKDEFNPKKRIKKKYNRIYTSGAFDLFHYGHLNILKRSKDITHHLIVGVSTDELIFKEKGHKPVVPFEKRAAIVESIKYVDKVIPQTDKNKQKIVDELRINAITVGNDWKGKYPNVSCELIYFPYTKNVSSTYLRSNVDEVILSKHK